MKAPYALSLTLSSTSDQDIEVAADEDGIRVYYTEDGKKSLPIYLSVEEANTLREMLQRASEHMLYTRKTIEP